MLNNISVILFSVLFAVTAASGQKVFRDGFPGDFLGAPLRKCWSVETGLRDGGKYASDNNEIIYLDEFNFLRTLDPYSGKPIWSSELGDLKAASIVFAKPLLVTSRTVNDKLEARTIDNDTGLTLKKIFIDLNQPQFLGQTENDYLIFDINGNVHSLSKKDGTLIISGKSLSAVQLKPDSWLRDKNMANGSLTDPWLLIYRLINPAGNMNASAFFMDGAINIIGDSLGNVASFDGDRQTVNWKVRLGGAVKSISGSEDGYLISCLDNFLYLLDRKSGDLLWKRRIDGRPGFNPIIRDGFVVSYALGDEYLQIIDLKNGKPVNKISSGSNSFILGAPLFYPGMLVLPTNKGFEGFGIDCE